MLALIAALAAPLAQPAPPPAPTEQPVPAVRARARANLASLIGPHDDPTRDLRGAREGVVAFELAIGADGKVQSCRITATSGSKPLDAKTCRIIQHRARFTPARDAEGRAVADRVESKIGWMVP
jgi:protein TonB